MAGDAVGLEASLDGRAKEESVRGARSSAVEGRRRGTAGLAGRRREEHRKEGGKVGRGGARCGEEEGFGGGRRGRPREGREKGKKG